MQCKILLIKFAGVFTIAISTCSFQRALLFNVWVLGQFKFAHKIDFGTEIN